jgi:septation ring formation regulator EzrA
MLDHTKERIEWLRGQIRVCTSDIADPTIRERGIERTKERIREAEEQLSKLYEYLEHEKAQQASVKDRLDAYQNELQGLLGKKRIEENAGRLNALKNLQAEAAELAKLDPRILEIVKQLQNLN